MKTIILAWHLSSRHLNHIQGKTAGTLSPPPPLHPSSIYSITWQESRYFPWDSMSSCPLTTSNSAHALYHHSLPLPTACSQLTTLQFTSNQRALLPRSFLLVLVSLLVFPRHVPFRVNRMLARSQRFIQCLFLFFSFHLCLFAPTSCPASNRFLQAFISSEGGRNHGWMNRWLVRWTDGVRARMCGYIEVVFAVSVEREM